MRMRTRMRVRDLLVGGVGRGHDSHAHAPCDAVDGRCLCLCACVHVPGLGHCWGRVREVVVVGTVLLVAFREVWEVMLVFVSSAGRETDGNRVLLLEGGAAVSVTDCRGDGNAGGAGLGVAATHGSACVFVCLRVCV